MEGAPAEDLGLKPVPDEVKQERWERFMAHQQAISAARLQRKIGTEIEVLIDEVDDEGAVARSGPMPRRSTVTLHRLHDSAAGRQGVGAGDGCRRVRPLGRDPLKSSTRARARHRWARRAESALIPDSNDGMESPMSPWLRSFSVTLLPGLAMPAGALLAIHERIHPRWLETELRHAILAFGAGALLAAVALVLVPEGMAALPGG